MPLKISLKCGKAIGEANVVPWTNLEFERVILHEVELHFPLKQKTKNSPADLCNRIVGKIFIRVLLTKANGIFEQPQLWVGNSTIPDGSAFRECTFDCEDKSLRKKIKTGDLIIYHEGGLMGHMMNLATSSEYSRVGMALRIPEKYTDRAHLFVLELTINQQRFVDAWKDEPVLGMTIFKLWERVYSVQGGSIWLLPLKEAIESDPLANMLDQIFKSLLTPQTLPYSLGNIPVDMSALLNEFGIKDPIFYCDLLSSHMVMSFLRLGAKRFPDPSGIIQTSAPFSEKITPTPFTYPLDLVLANSIFESPIALRSEKPKN